MAGFHKVRALAGATVVAATLSLPATAHAADSVMSASVNNVETPKVPPAEVLPETVTKPVAQPTEVLGETVENTGLAATGADVVGVAAIGAGAIAIGAVMLVGRRRKAGI